MKASGKPLRILFAGGGTGGHIFPAMAVADAFVRLAPQAQVRFAGSNYGLESRVVPQRGFHLYRIAVRGLFQVSWRRRLWVMAMLPVAFLQSVIALLTFRPHLVIGVGGYASGPVMATAVLLGFKTVIQEQNAYPGMTNRLLGRFVRMAFVPMEGLEQFFRRSMVVSNPVRPEIMALRSQPDDRKGPPMVFVFGGSQGAHVLNQAMIEALPALIAWGGEMEILHQTGPAELETVKAAYQGLDSAQQLKANVLPFVEEMHLALARCSLVVGRAGASAVAELVAARRPSILVPIPGTSGEHQLRNAQWLAQAGASELMEQASLNGENLARLLVELVGNPDRLKIMENATDDLFTGNAAQQVAEQCLQLLGREEGNSFSDL